MNEQSCIYCIENVVNCNRKTKYANTEITKYIKAYLES